jgi:hypothetical protein
VAPADVRAGPAVCAHHCPPVDVGGHTAPRPSRLRIPPVVSASAVRDHIGCYLDSSLSSRFGGVPSV